jgi:hypothetical protein
LQADTEKGCGKAKAAQPRVLLRYLISAFACVPYDQTTPFHLPPFLETTSTATRITALAARPPGGLIASGLVISQIGVEFEGTPLSSANQRGSIKDSSTLDHRLPSPTLAYLPSPILLKLLTAGGPFRCPLLLVTCVSVPNFSLL